MKLISLTSLTLASVASMALAACASSSISPDKVAAPQAQIAAAEEAGAQEQPNAAMHLQLAQDQYQHARRLMREGENERAEYVLARAAADARLALELARLETTRHEASDAMKRIEELKVQHRLMQAE